MLKFERKYQYAEHWEIYLSTIIVKAISTLLSSRKRNITILQNASLTDRSGYHLIGNDFDKK